MILSILNSICPGWMQEHRFHPSRRWRFDFVNKRLMLAIEIEGGVFSNGRHVRGSGIKDIEKYNTAIMLGWKVLRYTPQQIPEMLDDVRRLCSMLTCNTVTNNICALTTI